MQPIIRLTRPSPIEDPWGDTVELRYAERSPDGTLFIASGPITMTRRDPNDCAPYHSEPLMRIPTKGNDALRSLMNQLWAMGVRPDDVGTPGHLAATQAHLEDFRAIAAKMLQMELPPCNTKR